MQTKYAFIKIRSSHASISQIVRILERTFPGWSLDVIDIKSLLKKNFHLIFINLFHVIALYGVKTFFSGKNILYNRFFGTPYLYRSISRLLSSYDVKNYIFTIQDCSLFNGKLEGVPNFVYTDHTVLANKFYPEFNEERDLLASSWLMLEREIYNSAEIVFTLSNFIRESVINDYGCSQEKVQCIYYAPFIEERAKISNLDSYHSKNILFVGMEWGRKGGALLIKAFERVLREVPEASLTIVGCAPEVALPNVHVVGPVSPGELYKYYERSSIFCLPTRREPFGIVFLEAMSYSIPVIGTRIGALPEFIKDGENGYLVGIDDDSVLASRLIDLLTHPEKCRQMGANGYEIYRRQFTLEAVSTSLRHAIMPRIRA